MHRMNKKYKNLVILFALVFLFLSIGQSALALELQYPVIPGFPNINCTGFGTPAGCTRNNQTAAHYLDYFFGLALIAAGIIAVVSLVISGIHLLASAGNPAAMADAKDRIVGPVVGIILLLFCFIILRTINPQLVNPRNLAVDLRPGAYLWRYFSPAGKNYFQKKRAAYLTPF